jgi:DNA-binding SARP family transcriptional activator
MGAYESAYGTYMNSQELEELIQRLQILLKVDPANVRAMHRLIRAQLALGNSEEIVRIFEQNRAPLQSYPPALRDLGAALEWQSIRKSP